MGQAHLGNYLSITPGDYVAFHMDLYLDERWLLWYGREGRSFLARPGSSSPHDLLVTCVTARCAPVAACGGGSALEVDEPGTSRARQRGT